LMRAAWMSAVVAALKTKPAATVPNARAQKTARMVRFPLDCKKLYPAIKERAAQHGVNLRVTTTMS
jgi:hypothetical protein